MTQPLDLRACRDPYRSAHDHVRAQRGHASEHDCSEDTCFEPAKDWALKAPSQCIADPVPVRSSKNQALYVSPLAEDYRPFCRRHHKAHDRRIREGVEA